MLYGFIFHDFKIIEILYFFPIIHCFWIFLFMFLQMDTTISFDHFPSNSKLLDVTLECCIDKSSHLRANEILTDHVFDSKSVINKLCFQSSSKSTFLIFFMLLVIYVFSLTYIVIWCSKIGARFCSWIQSWKCSFYVLLTDNDMVTHDVTSELFDSWSVYCKINLINFLGKMKI